MSQVGVLLKQLGLNVGSRKQRKGPNSGFLMPKISAKLKRVTPITEAPNADGVGLIWRLLTNNSLLLENLDRRKRCQLSSVASLSHRASTFICSTFPVMQRVARFVSDS